MTSWSDFEHAEPELATRAHAIFSATTNCVLATIRADGSPRVSGIDPFFLDGELWIGSIPGSRKGADLRRDPRLALHGIPWESRRVKEGRPDPGEGDAKVTGRAVPIDDPAEVRRIFEIYFADLSYDTPDDGELFRIDLDSVVMIRVEDPELVIDRWTPTEGATTVRRA
jgi:nitroimidazol reductase NimA-like FMN-containing flavoprotein (pyridoxamine 5'-phosphate oxidase superfamily)